MGRGVLTFFGHEAPRVLGLFPQTELQEVLGEDEETGLLDGSEAASPDLCEEKTWDNTELPVEQAACQQAVPATAQVGFAGGP